MAFPATIDKKIIIKIINFHKIKKEPLKFYSKIVFPRIEIADFAELLSDYFLISKQSFSRLNFQENSEFLVKIQLYYHGRSIKFATPVQYQQERDNRTRWTNHFRRICLEKRRQDELSQIWVCF